MRVKNPVFYQIDKKITVTSFLVHYSSQHNVKSFLDTVSNIHSLIPCSRLLSDFQRQCQPSSHSIISGIQRYNKKNNQ